MQTGRKLGESRAAGSERLHEIGQEVPQQRDKLPHRGGGFASLHCRGYQTMIESLQDCRGDCGRTRRGGNIAELRETYDRLPVAKRSRNLKFEKL